MDKIVEKALLFDFYGELLTENQKEVYGEYILDDLTVSEIAQVRGISRQGVHDMIRRCDKILEEYEQKLHLVEHFLSIKKMVSTIHQYAEELSTCEDKDTLQSRIADIKSLSSEILEQY